MADEEPDMEVGPTCTAEELAAQRYEAAQAKGDVLELSSDDEDEPHAKPQTPRRSTLWCCASRPRHAAMRMIASCSQCLTYRSEACSAVASLPILIWTWPQGHDSPPTAKSSPPPPAFTSEELRLQTRRRPRGADPFFFFYLRSRRPCRHHPPRRRPPLGHSPRFRGWCRWASLVLSFSARCGQHHRPSERLAYHRARPS